MDIYRKEKNKNYKIIIILIIFIFMLITISVILGKIYKKEQTENLSYDNLTTIKEVIEYYDSKYISEKESDN